MSENIPYIIAENGYYYVAYKEKVKVPEIVVSSKGIANGLSEEYNDGWDFGPDSYSPTSTSAIPYTQTSGIQEAADYLIAHNGGEMRLMDGVYDTTNAPFQSYINHSGAAQAKVLLRDGAATSKFIGISITGSAGELILNSEVTGAPYSEYGTTLKDTSAGSSTPSYIIAVASNSSDIEYQSNINIDIDRINAVVQSGNGIGGFDFKSAVFLRIGAISIGVNQGWNIDEPTNTTQIGINLSGGYSSSSVVTLISCAGGLYNVVSLGHHPQIFYLAVSGCMNAIYIDNEIHEGFIASMDIEYTQNIFNMSEFSFNLRGAITPLKIEHISIANNNNYSNGASWQNAVSFLVLPSSFTPKMPIYIDLLAYYGGFVPDNYYPDTNTLYIHNIQYTNTTLINSYFSGNPAISANPPVSGTPYQNTNPYDIIIDLPVYASTSGTAGTVAYGKSATSTVTEMTPKFVSGSTSSSAVDIVSLRVPAGWYFEFTASGVTFGTASVFAE